MPLSTLIGFALLLSLSNLFMTFAWYGHLKYLHDQPWWIAVLASWGIAFFEYLIQVPANRLGATAMTLPQLKISQEVITLCVFVPFSVFVMGAPIRLNFVYAGICMLGAVYFVFRG
jgi:uncharacterized protein (DUF486 family)